MLALHKIGDHPQQKGKGPKVENQHTYNPMRAPSKCPGVQGNFVIKLFHSQIKPSALNQFYHLITLDAWTFVKHSHYSASLTQNKYTANKARTAGLHIDCGPVIQTIEVRGYA